METYNYSDWERDGVLNPQIGQPVAEQIVREMRNCVPPLTNMPDLMQTGEIYDHDSKTGKPLYTTFKRTEKGWIYCGNCMAGKTEHRCGYFETLYPPKI